MSIFSTGLKHLNKHTKIVPVFLTINNSYAPYAATAIHSLTQHVNKKRYYRVIILHDGLNWVNRIRLRSLATDNVAIQFKKISGNLYLKAIIKYCSRRKGAGDFFSSAVYYYRFFIPRLFPLYDKCVYIDSDTILRGDIGDLFDMDLDGNVVAAMVDPKVDVIKEFREYVNKAVGVPYTEYTNSGVLVMDMKALRKLGYLSALVDTINKYDADLVAPDQDYMNVILRGKIKHMDPNWNMEPGKKLSEDVKLIHFNLFNKPWHYENVPQEKLFWNAARGTGFYGELKRQLAAFDEEKQKEDHAKIDALLQKASRLAKVKKPIIEFVEK